jgi:hypothetical protein
MIWNVSFSTPVGSRFWTQGFIDVKLSMGMFLEIASDVSEARQH